MTDKKVNKLLKKGANAYKNDKFEESIKFLEEAANLDQQNRDALMILAMAHEKLGNSKEAISWYQKLLLNIGDDAQILYMLGGVLAKSGDPQQARACMERAVKLDPNNGGYWYALSVTYMMGDEEEKALKALEKTVKLLPKHDLAWATLGAAHSNLGCNETAIECIEKSLKINPQNADAWFGMAVAYMKLGKRDKAKESLAKAVEINPYYKDKLDL